jgi:hypothetical protein
MTPILTLYLLNTLLFVFPLAKQFLIITRSPIDDKHLVKKVLSFMVCLGIMAAMWLCYLRIRGAAWFFFLIAIAAVVYAYKDEKFKQ